MPTVLLLDRESSRRQRLVELIKRLDPGIHIEAFIKPEPALSWLAWQVADLVVADSLFPSMDAAALIQKWRINLFLSKWLAYCVQQGHQFGPPQRSDASRRESATVC